MKKVKQPKLSADRLGVDIGGVIKGLSFMEELGLPDNEPKPDAFEVLRELSEWMFKDNIWLISKCRARTQTKTLEWLSYHDFYNRTRIQPKQVIFTRADEQKAIVAKRLKLTHYIDDKFGVLRSMAQNGIVNLYLFKEEPIPPVYKPEIVARVTIVGSWGDVRKTLLRQSPNARLVEVSL